MSIDLPKVIEAYFKADKKGKDESSRWSTGTRRRRRARSDERVRASPKSGQVVSLPPR